MQLGLTDDQEALVTRLEAIATRFRDRAAEYDRQYEVPSEDMEELHAEGLLLCNAAEAHGGLGFGTSQRDALSYCLCMEYLAQGNPASAHCFQVQSHTVQMISDLATDDQRRRYFEPTLKRGALFSGAASEPGRTARGQYSLQTTATKTAGGYVLNGVKNYATNATHAEWHLVFALMKDVPGPDGLLMFMVRNDTPGLTVDQSVWRPLGMRAAVSPNLILRDVFVDDANVLGEPGIMIKQRYQAKFHLSFASNYLGSARFMLDWALSYIRERGTGGDPFTQLHLGELICDVDAARWMIYRAAWLWEEGVTVAAELASNEAKYFAQKAVTSMLTTLPRITGSSSLFEKYPFERYVRDLHVHTLHDNHDRAAQILGAASLGLEYDITNKT